MNRINVIVQELKVRWLKKSLKETIIDFGSQLKSPGRILVLLPADTSLRSKVLKNSRFLAETLSMSEICFVSMPNDEIRELARREGFRSFAPHQLEMSWYNFPNNSFFHRVRNLRSTMVVDLDFERNCFNAAVTVASGAPLRIGRFGVWGRPIHNIEVKSVKSADPYENLRSLLGVISSLKTGAVN